MSLKVLTAQEAATASLTIRANVLAAVRLFGLWSATTVERKALARELHIDTCSLMSMEYVGLIATMALGDT